MTQLSELFELYKNNAEFQSKRIILCDWKTSEGYEINSLKEFNNYMQNFPQVHFLIDKIENEKFLIYDYFTMLKTKPYVVTLVHPLMTNAYYKDLPDQTIDVHVNQDGVYRYVYVDYGSGIKEYVIEFPNSIKPEIKEKFKDILPDVSDINNISLIFTNSDRFTVLEPSNFLIYNLEDIYPDWAVKKITTLNLSKKVWNELKAIK
jgi:hypothetical protein